MFQISVLLVYKAKKLYEVHKKCLNIKNPPWPVWDKNKQAFYPHKKRNEDCVKDKQ